MVWFEEPEKFDAEVLNALVQETSGGELHDAVRKAAIWRTRDEAAQASKRLAELRSIYVQGPQSIDDPEWSDLASLLCAPPEARFGRISYPQAGVHYDVFAARNQWFGLLVLTDESTSHVRTFRGEQPSEAIIAALKEWVWKSDEQPIRVTRSELDAADNAMGLREPLPHLSRVQQLTQLPAYFVGEFYAECQHGGDRRRRSSRPLLAYGVGTDQYDAGCWTLQTTARGADVEMYFAPADIYDLAHRLEQLRNDID